MNEIKIYTFPKAGEMPKPEDEYLSMREDEWFKIGKKSLSKPYEDSDEGFVRRPLKMVSQTELLEELGEVPKPVLCGSEFRFPQKDIEEMPSLPERENELIKQRVQAIMEQREEVLNAFIAKYGFEPDRFVQIQECNKWSVYRRTDEEMVRLRKGLGI